jgi:iron uptake system component EfeO
VPNGGDGAATVVTVESTDESCAVTPDSVAGGAVTFRVTNDGTTVTEFYLLADDGVSIVSEVEDIAPGATRELTVVADAGSYVTVCKPGMSGEGVGSSAFTVTG